MLSSSIMTRTYIPKAKPGRPKQTPPKPIEVSPPLAVELEKPLSDSPPLSVEELRLRAYQCYIEQRESEEVQKEETVPTDIAPILAYQKAGSQFIHEYYYKYPQSQISLQSFIRFSVERKAIHFDKLPRVGDIILLHDNGLMVGARMVHHVETIDLNPKYPDSLSVFARQQIEKHTKGIRHEHHVTIDDWREPTVTSWYALIRIDR